MKPQLEQLRTEARNPASTEIDRLSTAEMLRVINDADRAVAEAVASQIDAIAKAVDRIAEAITDGGRLFYIGAGTSGRLGVLDASECPPTFQTPPELVQGLIAGGDTALRNAVEQAEDRPEQGRADLEAKGLSSKDVLVGIAASGRTPYVLGALDYAKSLGAFTVALSCTGGSKLAEAADLAITPVPGPEVITGSTRMRAGTATKLVLNMLSTGVMIRLGYVYGNLMVNMKPTNEKLAERARNIVAAVAEVSAEQAGELMNQANDVRVAVVMQKLGVGRAEAIERVQAARGNLRKALAE